MLRFRKIPVGIKFMDKRGGDIIKIFRRNFLSHSADKFRSGTLLCYVSENFRLPKSLWIRGGYSRFSVENFLSYGAENFRRANL